MTAASRPPAPAADGLSRRSFLTRSAAGGAGVLLSGGVTGLFGTASAIPGAPKGGAGYGPLVKDPAGVLSLPAGFRYTIVARTGETRSRSGASAASPTSRSRSTRTTSASTSPRTPTSRTASSIAGPRRRRRSRSARAC